METRSYAKANGYTCFDWNAFLASETHTPEEWDEAQALSAKWPTCACGVQCAAIPRSEYEYGMPLDYELRGHGTMFHDAINHRWPKAARIYMQQIETRSAQILAEMATSIPTP